MKKKKITLMYLCFWRFYNRKLLRMICLKLVKLKKMITHSQTFGYHRDTILLNRSQNILCTLALN